MKRIPMINGDEYDALTKWYHVLRWHAGERNRIKRQYRRRERRQAKLACSVRIKSNTKEVDEIP